MDDLVGDGHRTRDNGVLELWVTDWSRAFPKVPLHMELRHLLWWEDNELYLPYSREFNIPLCKQPSKVNQLDG